MSSEPTRAAPLRIAFVLSGMSAGGSERVVATLANYWAEQGRDISIISFDDPGTDSYYRLDSRVRLVRLGIPTHSRPRWRAFSQTWKRVKGLRTAVDTIDPHLVISFLTKVNIMTLMACGKSRSVIVSERNNPIAQRFDPMWAWARSHFYPRAFALVTMTKGALDFYPPAQRPRGRTIPNPTRLPDEWVSRRGGRVIAGVGRLVPQKRFDLLLRAFSIAAPDFPDWILIIWGDGELRPALEGLRDQLGLKGRVQFPGISKRPGEWIETADVFVLSSEYEGWTNALAEAMGAGIASISFACDFGPADMITNGVDGVLVPPLDVEALAGAMSRVLGDASLRDSIGKAAAASAQRFTVPAVAAQWDELIAEAIGVD